jgi:hypothetical protein
VWWLLAKLTMPLRFMSFSFYKVYDPLSTTKYARIFSAMVRDENGTDIFRSYSRPNPFRGVLIRPYPSPDI